MSTPVKIVVRFCLFIFVQAFVLDQIPPLNHLVTPYLYFLFILWLPFKMGKKTQLFLAFLLGLSLDAFTKTYGLHAAACVLVAYIRPFLIELLVQEDDTTASFTEPSVRSMGFAPYLTYLTLLTFTHHFLLFFLEAFQSGGMVYFIVKTAFSTLISLLLILLTELLFSRKQRTRANTAA